VLVGAAAAACAALCRCRCCCTAAAARGCLLLSGVVVVDSLAKEKELRAGSELRTGSCQLPALLLPPPLPLLLAAGCWLLPSPSLPLLASCILACWPAGLLASGLRVGAPKAKSQNPKAPPPPFVGRRGSKQATRWKKHQHQLACSCLRFYKHNALLLLRAAAAALRLLQCLLLLLLLLGG
jgi:hypothetical protein